MTSHRIRSLAASCLFVLAGCHIGSRTNLIAPEMRVDPFGDAQVYFLPEEDGTPSEEAILRLADGGFISLNRDAPLEMDEPVLRYDFARIDAADWPPTTNSPQPGTPYLTSMCEVYLLDRVEGCWLYVFFVDETGELTSIATKSPEGKPDSITVSSPAKAIRELHTAWTEGRFDSDALAAPVPTTPSAAQQAGFDLGVFAGEN